MVEKQSGVAHVKSEYVIDTAKYSLTRNEASITSTASKNEVEVLPKVDGNVTASLMCKKVVPAKSQRQGLLP